MKNVKKIIIVIAAMPFVMTMCCLFLLTVISRLVGAFLYNLTDFIQYSEWRFDETKEVAHELVTLPAQCYDVCKDIYLKRIKTIE